MRFALFMYWQGFRNGVEYANAIERGGDSMNDEAKCYRAYIANATRAERLLFEREFMTAYGATPERVIPPAEKNRIWEKVKGILS